MKPQRPDFRLPLASLEFRRIAEHEYAYWDFAAVLFHDNEEILTANADFPQTYADPGFLDQLNHEQLVVLIASIFHGQVCNGGIEQFFWNYPHLVIPMQNVAASINSPRLIREYSAALDQLEKHSPEWSHLRASWRPTATDLDWETFKESYKLLDLGWFNHEFWDESTYDAAIEKRVIVKPGIKSEMSSAIVDFCLRNESALVRPP